MTKFLDASSKFVISDTTGNDGGFLEIRTVVGSNYVAQGFCVISYSSSCAN